MLESTPGIIQCKVYFIEDRTESKKEDNTGRPSSHSSWILLAGLKALAEVFRTAWDLPYSQLWVLSLIKGELAHVGVVGKKAPGAWTERGYSAALSNDCRL